jgi:hypothetical protein
MIPLEALVQFGMTQPEHRWFGEFSKNKLVGFIYQHKQLIHFGYKHVPSIHSPIYGFIQSVMPSFITHGKKELIEPIIACFKAKDIQSYEESVYVQQTKETIRAIQVELPKPKGLRIRFADRSDIPNLLYMFQGSAVNDQVDTTLVSSLVVRKGVLLVESNNRLIGSLMRLKESPNYWLLGGLYITPTERYQGLASLLGQYMVKEAHRHNKQVCFYYSNPELKEFYNKAELKSIGTWVSYSLNSKPMI